VDPTNPRAAIRADVLRRLDETSADVVALLAGQVPAYAALSRDQRGEVLDIARWATGRILDLWVEDTQLTEADARRFRGIGAARALDGRPLAAVLRAYRLAGTHLTETIERTAGPRLTAADAMALARLWMTSIETLSEALYAGHSAATATVLEDRDRAVDDLLTDLLAGRQVTRTGLADRGRQLGLALPRRLALLVLHLQGDLDPEALCLSLWPDLPEQRAVDTLVRVQGSTATLLAPHDAPVATGAGPDRAWRGVRLADLGASDLPRAHRLAQHLLEHAPERASAGRPLLDEADALAVALATGHPDADAPRLRALVLGALDPPAQHHLREGLEAYLALGSATEAAESLGLHAQSMRHRLRRITHLTGRDPRVPWDRFVLEVAGLGR
jgi:hypothetical protein